MIVVSANDDGLRGERGIRPSSTPTTFRIGRRTLDVRSTAVAVTPLTSWIRGVKSPSICRATF